ncbi:MAG: flippase-like domain-containing protein [Bacteroidales bacterium]|nr:flippase-like domain-containing protein [Bacteroidales bacterium]
MAETERPAPLDNLQGWKVAIPVVIGLAATAFLFWREYTPGTFDAFTFTWHTVFWLVIAALFMSMRDIGYMIRIRLLSDNELGWLPSFRIIMLWEFASAVTPSAVGGTSVALFFVNKEGISAGRSTGIVMVTSFLDELYFALMFPLVIFGIGYTRIFGDVTTAVTSAAWIGYCIKLAYICVLSYGMFINPRGLKWLLLNIFRLPFLRKWRTDIACVGQDIVETARYFKRWPMVNWVKAFAATFLSWTSRYWVVNALIIAFFGFGKMGLGDNLIVFGRQLVMWITMLVAPTPGGAGFAEYAFKEFLSSYIPSSPMALAFCWRLISYYPYLLIGAVLLPRWAGSYLKKKE